MSEPITTPDSRGHNEPPHDKITGETTTLDTLSEALDELPPTGRLLTSARLAAYLEALELRPAELARRLNVTRSTIRDWMRGDNPIPPAHYEAIFDALLAAHQKRQKHLEARATLDRYANAAPHTSPSSQRAAS